MFSVPTLISAFIAALGVLVVGIWGRLPLWAFILFSLAWLALVIHITHTVFDGTKKDEKR